MSKQVVALSIVVALLPGSLAAQSGRRGSKATPPPNEPPAGSPGIGLDEITLKGLKARSIGPAVMGGRVSDIAIDPDNAHIFYVALGTGGVFKTTDNGATFSAVFEKEAVASTGAVAVAPSDPKIVWVGSGEANDRNSSSWGNGVYRSTDSGATWTQVGLKDSKTIARIVVHPKDPNTAWVAAMGDLWNPSAERGLYKTIDAGKTWKAVLQAAAPHANKVGCGEVAIDPSDPNVLYAALYARRRTPWSFASGPEHTDGKDVGGVFKSTDGGTTWKKLDRGLPGQTGRIGISVHAKNPQIVYAIVQSWEGGTSSIDDIRSKKGGVFRSDDGGETWRRVNALNPRPFYFSQIRVDPQDDKKVYVLGFMLHVSEDGGSTFLENRFKNVHADCHALAIDPRNPKRVLLGTDGGLYQTYDAGGTWAHLNNTAIGEFYRIAMDMRSPYRICGGLQDNINWVGPSATNTKEGIRNADWIAIYGGDGFYCSFDPVDPNIVYAESQSGYVYRLNMANGEAKNFRPEPAEGQTAFRFHWNSPFIPSTTKGKMYLGGNRIFELTERGEVWKAISPDLSARDPEKTVTTGSGAETFGVVYTLSESPLKPGLIWAGTDDGKLWVTENGGENWTDLSSNVPQPARGLWMSRIEPSHHDAKVAYLAVDGHRSGNYAPLAYRTADGGRTWQSIAANLPPDGPVKVVREDLTSPDLLFAGTEFALFVSLDRGGHWTTFGGLPTVAVDDIAIHPRDRDLVVATHGRSLYIVDDIRPLEAFTVDVQNKNAYLFEPRPAAGFYPLPGFTDSNGSAIFRGENPPIGAILSVFVKNFTGDSIKIAVANSAGQTVANLTAPGTPGFNRIVWDLKITKDLLNEYGGEGQKFVRSGDYDVTLTFGDTKQTQKLNVAIAPGIETR
ncbi:MAG: hypothetical protein HYX76_09220 [Acidobacteria bacterium]|nr:hypothetical protein [Acidobacteriota bacterium]